MAHSQSGLWSNIDSEGSGLVLAVVYKLYAAGFFWPMFILADGFSREASQTSKNF